MPHSDSQDFEASFIKKLIERDVKFKHKYPQISETDMNILLLSTTVYKDNNILNKNDNREKARHLTNILRKETRLSR